MDPKLSLGAISKLTVVGSATKAIRLLVALFNSLNTAVSMDVFDIYDAGMRLASDPNQTWWIAPLAWLGDAALTALVVLKVPYTEIDFTTYMEQVRVYLKGVRDYRLLEGPTGPCVYPAGHVYAYSAIYHLTDEGTNIRKGQIIFAALYLATLALVIAVYRKCKAPPYLFPLLILSKRLHSIFVLRLFNDCFAVFFLFAAILAFQYRRWAVGSVAFSLGISVKMSILLAVPGVVFVVGQAMPVSKAILVAALIPSAQLLLAQPFLVADAGAYVERAFEFSRQFLFKWTVNWRFVGEEVFLSEKFQLQLVLAHFTLLYIFARTRWTTPANCSISVLFRRIFKPLPTAIEKSINAHVTPEFVTTTILSSVILGVACARSLHYQFYAYIAWATPFMYWRARLHPILIYVLWAVQEWAWNVFPSTDSSSATVVTCLFVQILSVWWGTRNDGRNRAEGLKQEDSKHHS